jgi:hypothetical protein
MAQLEANVDARKFLTIDGVGEGSGGYPSIAVGGCGSVGCGRSKW